MEGEEEDIVAVPPIPGSIKDKADKMFEIIWPLMHDNNKTVVQYAVDRGIKICQLMTSVGGGDAGGAAGGGRISNSRWNWPMT